MQYSIIQKSQLEGAHRLDAEYYQPEYLEMEDIFRKSDTERIVNLTDFVKKGIFDLSPDKYVQQGTPFIRVQNIKNGFLDEENLVFISEQTHNEEKKTELRQLDIVLSKVGTVGEVSIIPSHYPRANFSQNVIGLKVKAERIPKGFLALFLLSRLGQLQIARANMPQVQAKLELQDIRDLRIIRLDTEQEKYFHDRLLQTEQLIENSKSLYSQAENLLLEELGLKNFKIEDDLSYIVNLSEVKSAHRADAEYFQPKYEKIMSLIRANGGMAFGDLVSMKKGFEPGSEAYQGEGKLFIRVSSLSKNGIEDKDQKYLSEDLYKKLKNDFEPRTGEILLTKDATPGIAYVLKERVEGIISGGILRLKIKNDIDTEYLALCINSIIGQMQAERDAGGSIIAHWKPEQIKKMLIPILPKPAQQKIADLVRQSHESRKKAKKLLEEAKSKVENLIERGS